MAKLLNKEVDSQVFNTNSSVVKIGLIGLIIGALYWFLVALFDYYTSSLNLASNLATILVGTVGLIIMIKMRVLHSLIIVVASALTLWGLALWTDGFLWWEILLSSAILYMLSYILFSWNVRIKQTSVTLLVVALIVIAIRIAVNW